MSSDFVPYDPGWLVEMARTQHRDRPWLADALARCTRVREESRAYHRFVEADAPNEPGSAWHFETTLRLEHPREGTLVLDILRGERVGGVEYLSRL